ncbi:MAG: hypothetical protein AB7S75_02725 [Desulfococcaceae bacterium]
MKKLRFMALLLMFSVCLIQEFADAAEIYWIKVKPSVTGPFTVDVEIQTNIQEPAIFSLSLEIEGQKPNDTFIGTGIIKVPIADGKGRATIDGTKNVFPFGSRLPSGNYNVEASFHPLWSENRATASNLGIRDSIKGKSVVNLGASGATADSVMKKAEGQKWVMMNVHSNMPYDQNAWEVKFGTWQEVEYRGEGNPNILKMYYFKSIDMTLMVNALKQEILTYRMGLKYK